MAEEMLSQSGEGGKYSARYIRLENLRAPSYVTFFELGLYTQDGILIAYPNGTVATAQSYRGSNIPAWGIDGNISTNWHASGSSAWFRIDMQQSIAFDQIKILPVTYQSMYNIQDYDLFIGDSIDNLILKRSVRGASFPAGWSTLLD